jgi:ATP-binding cassette subfamily B protein
MRQTLSQQVCASLWPYRGRLCLALVQVLLLSGVELLKPWPLKLILDNVLGGQRLSWPVISDWLPETLLLAACAALVGVYVMAGGLTLLNDYTLLSIGHSLVNDLRGALHQHLQRLPLAFHHRSRIGDRLYHIVADAKSIQDLTMNGIFPVLTSLVLLVGMGVVMLQLDWMLTLLALSACPVLFIATLGDGCTY